MRTWTKTFLLWSLLVAPLWCGQGAWACDAAAPHHPAVQAMGDPCQDMAGHEMGDACCCCVAVAHGILDGSSQPVPGNLPATSSGRAPHHAATGTTLVFPFLLLPPPNPLLAQRTMLLC